MPTVSAITEKTIRNLPFFQILESAEREILLKDAAVNDYPKKEILFLQGDKPRQFFVIIKGWVKLYNLSEDGREVVVGMLKQGDVIGDIEAFEGAPHSFSAIVVENAHLVEISTEVMRERVLANARLAASMLCIIMRNLYSLRIENGHLTTMNAPQRLSCLLLRLSAAMVGKGGTFNLPYDKSIIAAQLGMDPATLSRVFAKLEEKGVTNKGSEVHIQNFSKLSACCCCHCPVPEGECAGRR